MIKKEPVTLTTDLKNYRIHYLKTVEPYYSDVEKGLKTFEVRLFDRDYKVGDYLELIKYDVDKGELGGRIIKRITYMLEEQPYVPEGYVILGMVDDFIYIPY